MARRVSWGIQHDHAAVAEHILVVWLRLDLVVAFDPALERSEVDAGAGFSAVIAFQSPSLINSVAFGKDATWPVWSGW